MIRPRLNSNIDLLAAEEIYFPQIEAYEDSQEEKSLADREEEKEFSPPKQKKQ